VLGALRHQFTLQAAAAFDLETSHGREARARACDRTVRAARSANNGMLRSGEHRSSLAAGCWLCHGPHGQQPVANGL
ncbi:MAG TPA: hypothetical protein PKH36_13165, partial [Flavobacteriales bacterium]|nr:hypothetical protein [Flavobacteriales bacterium]